MRSARNFVGERCEAHIYETFEETVRREVEEETGLTVDDLELFGIYSGPD
jgi:ADP-ribose pyrophosphatase YjhB (NUDIX family)